MIYLIRNLKVECDPLINIITRCSRKEDFRATFNSVNEQTYDNIRWYITVESDELGEYLSGLNFKYPTKIIRVPKYHRIPNLWLKVHHHDVDTDYNTWDWEKWKGVPFFHGGSKVLGKSHPNSLKELFKEDKPILSEPQYYRGDRGQWCYSTSESRKVFFKHFPFELYHKIAEQHINEGYIVYLDDDDVYSTKDSIKTISEKIKDKGEDTLYVWRFFHHGRIVPQDEFYWRLEIKHPPILYEVGSGGVCFHSKYKKHTRWDEWGGGDYRTIKCLWDNIPNFYIWDDILYTDDTSSKKESR